MHSAYGPATPQKWWRDPASANEAQSAANNLAIPAAALVQELIEAADERRLQRLQKLLISQDLLSIDEPGFVPLGKTGAGVTLRSHLPALRARFHHHHVQTAVRRMDRGLRIRTPYRRNSRPPDPPCAYPGDERRELPSKTEPKSPKLKSEKQDQNCWPPASAPWHTSAIWKARAPKRRPNRKLVNISPAR